MMRIELPDFLAKAVERHLAREDRRETPQQVVEAVLRRWAVSEGLLEPHEDGGIKPEDLSSANDG